MTVLKLWHPTEGHLLLINIENDCEKIDIFLTHQATGINILFYNTDVGSSLNEKYKGEAYYKYDYNNQMIEEMKANFKVPGLEVRLLNLNQNDWDDLKWQLRKLEFNPELN